MKGTRSCRRIEPRNCLGAAPASARCASTTVTLLLMSLLLLLLLLLLLVDGCNQGHSLGVICRSPVEDEILSRSARSPTEAAAAAWVSWSGWKRGESRGVLLLKLLCKQTLKWAATAVGLWLLAKGIEEELLHNHSVLSPLHHRNSLPPGTLSTPAPDAASRSVGRGFSSSQAADAACFLCGTTKSTKRMQFCSAMAVIVAITRTT